MECSAADAGAIRSARVLPCARRLLAATLGAAKGGAVDQGRDQLFTGSPRVQRQPCGDRRAHMGATDAGAGDARLGRLYMSAEVGLRGAQP